MKENRHKAEDVLTRPWPGRQKERGRQREKEGGRRGRKGKLINITREEEKEDNGAFKEAEKRRAERRTRRR